MSEQTKIQWADDTINFWSGCTKVSDGCKNCYAEALSNRFSSVANNDPDNDPSIQVGGTIGKWGKGAPRKWHESAVKLAHRLNRKPKVCDKCGTAWQKAVGMCECNSISFHRRRIFSLSLGDWLDPEVPIEWLAEMLDTIRRCNQVDWLLVTKRPELFFERMFAVMLHSEKADPNDEQPYRAGTFCRWLEDWKVGNEFPKHVMVLTSVENQKAADERIPALLEIPAARHGLSCEPLLGPVNLLPWIGNIDIKECGLEHDPLAAGQLQSAMYDGLASAPCLHCIDWVIVGGESGAGARPCNVEWIRDIKDQCSAAGVPCFVKQLGAFTTAPQNVFWDAAKFLAGCHEFNLVELRDKKGGDMAEWPEDLRVREFFR